MFANIRRHQKWLWYVISAAVIISFTAYLSPNSRQNGGGGLHQQNVGTINGRPVSQGEYLDAQKEAHLKYLFMAGSWYGNDEFSRQNSDFIENQTKQRLLLKEKARELGIQVTAANVAEWIQDNFGRGKTFTENEYNQVLKNLGGHGVTEADLNRFARTEVATEHLLRVAGTPGRLVTPQEAEEKYRRENQQISAEAVFFFSSNYLAQVNLDQTNIATHYTRQSQNFREPDKIQVAYVEFPATNYLAEAEKALSAVTNLNQQLEEVYRARGTNFYTDTNGLPMTAEAAKAKIRDDEKQNLALREARKAATAFAETLLSLPTRQATNLYEVARTNKLAVKVTEPFGQFEQVKGLEVPEKFNQAAFGLSAEQPFIEEPIVGQDAVYIVALDKKIASRVPPLAEIQEKVTEDYKRMQSRELATRAGQEFYTKLNAGLTTGKSFNAVAAESGQSVTAIAPFSIVTRSIPGLDPRVDVSAVKNMAFSLKEGETSSFVPTREGGFVLHVNKFIPASDADVKAALPGYLASLQKAGASEAFQAWFSKEFQAAKMQFVNDKQPEKTGGATKSSAQ
jgi:hypothetical protein